MMIAVRLDRGQLQNFERYAKNSYQKWRILEEYFQIMNNIEIPNIYVHKLSNIKINQFVPVSIVKNITWLK